MAELEKLLGKMCFVKLKNKDKLAGFLRKPNLFEKVISFGRAEFCISVTNSGNFGSASFREDDVDYFFELVQKHNPTPTVEDDAVEVNSDETERE